MDTEAVQTKNEGGLLVIVTWPGYEQMTHHTINISNVHLNLSNENGSALLRCVRPRTKIYAEEPDDAAGYPSPRLTPLQ